MPNTTEPPRPNKRALDRREYLQRASDFAVRGSEHYCAKLTDDDVIDIRSAVKQRHSLLQYIRDNLSNDALTKQFGISENSLTRVVQGQTYDGVK